MATVTGLSYDAAKQALLCQGDWRVACLPELQTQLKKLTLPHAGTLNIQANTITTMDTAGAWLLQNTIQTLEQKGLSVTLNGLAKQHADLLKIIKQRVAEEKPLLKPPFANRYARIGKVTLSALGEFSAYFSFIGYLALEFFRLLGKPNSFRFNAIAAVVYRTGFQALPIITLLSFMIGVVITFQMGLQLKSYGANIYIVDLLGLSILREFAPLITAIMVAGRSGSAFTAQLGMMKINQEIDSLNTMGVTPAELLLIPRIIGLFIALPLLTMWADVFGVFGGMLMANSMLSISPYDFLQRFPAVIPLRALLIGLGKAPVFALIISSVGCFQGMQVKENADSVGANTTRSVVLGIFFIIVADAIFSIIFSKLKL